MQKNVIVKFFSSLKLTLFILFSLAATSIIGTIIPQDLPKSQYASHFSHTTFKLLDFFGIFDMYHSWWFLALLSLLIINLIFCSLKHYRTTYNRVFKENPVLTPNIEKTILHKNSFKINSRNFKIEKIETFIKKVLKSKNFQKNEQNGEIHYFVNQNRYSDFGYYLVHLSLIIIAIGAILGSIFGFKGYINIPVGQTKSFIFCKKIGMKELGFKIKCVDFKINFYPNGTPKEYRSKVEVIDKNKSFQADILVNHPLKYRGIKFYQASYGTTGQKVFIVVKSRTDNKVLFNNEVSIGDVVSIKNRELKFLVERYSNNFQGFGPAARIVVLKGMAPEQNFIIFKNYPDFDKKHRNGKFTFILKKATFQYYTGLQVSKDPGVNIVWLGCFLMILGLFISFFIYHKKFWIKVSQDKKNTYILFAGSMRKNRLNFDHEFNKLVENLKEVVK
jgi:cytochrome c biogenesis protein